MPLIQGVNNKVESLKIITENEKFNLNKVLYIGNDINDYQVMKICGYTVCPADGHEKIKQIATITLETKGGHGVVREILEKVLKFRFD